MNPTRRARKIHHQKSFTSHLLGAPWTVSSGGLQVLVGKFPASRPVDVAFNYAKNHVDAQLNALAGLRFLVSARRLASGPNFLFQRCDGISRSSIGLTLIASAKAASVPLASEDSQIGVRMRVCLYGQDRTYPGFS
jgi:hypothetical protein